MLLAHHYNFFLYGHMKMIIFYVLISYRWQVTYHWRKNIHNFTEMFIILENISENLLHNGNIKVSGLNFWKSDWGLTA